MRAFRDILVLIVAALTFVSCGGDEKAQDPESQDGPKENFGRPAPSLEVTITENIKSYIASGADPKKSYIIEYHLAADNVKKARKVVAWGEANGFTPVLDESQVVRGEWVHVSLVKENKLEVNPIWNDAKGITTLAEKLECEYEGWGFQETP